MALSVPFATAAELASRWRSLSAEEQTLAGVLLADASQMILDEDKRGILTDLTDPAGRGLKRVVCAMVKRAMLSSSGDAVSQMQQSAGPFSMSTTYSNPSGDLYLTSAERRSIGFSRQRAAGVDMWTPPED